jgi:hypothetical protein
MLRHFAARRAAHYFVTTFGVGAVAAACSAGSGGNTPGDGTGATSGATTGGTSSGGTGGTLPLGGTGGTIPPGGNGTGGGPDCAGDLIKGEPVPVDVYIMLDISGSMLTATGSGATKWDAVKGAINTFLMDPMSAGLGVAIQYFPLQKAAVPASCTTSAECGAEGGTCLMKYCALYEAGYAQCETDADCMNALVKDDGPCEASPAGAMQCRLSGAACTTAAECQTIAMTAMGSPNVGPCIALGRCAMDMTRVCEAATLCSPGNMCEAVTSNFCVHETLCDQATYATPAVEFGELPGAAAAITASIEAQMPRGETPSRPALRGAIDHAREWAASHPGHSVVAVLATDGLPTDCSNGNAAHPSSDAEVEEVVAVATEGLTTSPNVSTFVVGVFAGDDTTAPVNLNRIAVAGGTNQAYMVDASGMAVNTEFTAALNAIRTSRLGCEFQIPTPPPGQTLDYRYVNVVLNDAQGAPTEIPRVLGGSDRCAEVGGGWYYDPDLTDTSTVAPTRIIACPSTCGMLTSTVGGSVQIKLGCRTTER